MKKSWYGYLTILMIVWPLGVQGMSCEVDCGDEYGCQHVSGTNYIGCGYYELNSRCMCTVQHYSTYDCVSGYYGASGSFVPTCNECPSGGYSPEGTQRITGCYIRAGQNLSDGTGTYTFTNNCYYSA